MLGGGVLAGAIAPDAATAVATIGTAAGGIVAFVLRRSSVASGDSAAEGRRRVTGRDDSTTSLEN
ncbi:hypothetical protein ABZY57_07290 [Streptomyces sp. NPDC006450]|uniref:hypothetical protein n=1 Tax=Streptomyces sp. NPDC006450 TaxID=3155458 RepID=UPI0033B140F8